MSDTAQVHIPWTQRISSFFADAMRKLLFALLVGGLLGGLLTYFADELRAWGESLIIGGRLTGSYVLKTFVYDDKTQAWVPYTMTFDLRHAGTRVFGKIHSATSDYVWRAYGYFREPVLSLSYENVESAAAGTGTYTFKQDVPYVMWGHWIGVECDDNKSQRFVAQCPAILYRSDRANEQNRYSSFMSRSCITITPDSGPCPVKKTSAKAKAS